MPRTESWQRSVPRFELDQRAHEAYLRHQRTDELVLLARAPHHLLRRLLYRLSFGRLGGEPQDRRQAAD